MKVRPSVGNVLNFLWRESNTEPISVYEWHIFGAEGSPTRVNYALQQVGQDCKDNIVMITKLINRYSYMDDFVESVASKGEEVETYKPFQKSLGDRGFQLTECICYSESDGRFFPSQISSVFEMLGLFSPFTMKMRLLLKGIWIGRSMSKLSP